MVRMVKFQTSSMRIGPLEGTVLYRVILVSFVILLSVFFLGEYGFVSLILLPLVLLRIQYDYVDEYIRKKLMGWTVFDIYPLINEERAAYEVFGSNYGLSEQRDKNILHTWSSVLDSLSEDVAIIRFPYEVPIHRFQKGVSEYDSLFSEMVCYADAYFIIVNKFAADDLERTLRNHGVSFRRLAEEEERALNDRF